MTRQPLALCLTALCLTALWLTALCLTATTAEAQVKEAWVTHYDGVKAGGLSPNDYVQDMVVRDGFVYVTGYESRFSAKYATAKYDYAGKEQWVRRVADGQSQHAEALAVDAKGNVFVTGWQKVVSAGIDAVTLKYGPDGKVVWKQRYKSSGGNNQPNDIALDAAGNVYVTGGSWIAAQKDFDVLLLKYDPAGKLLWSRTLDGGYTDTAHEVAIDKDGNAIVAGLFEPNAILAKYSPAGKLLWQHVKKGFSTNDEWRRITTDGNRNIYVLGEISPPGQSNHLWTAKYDPNGKILWEDNYTGTASKSCYAGGVAVMPDGGAVICGQSWDLPNQISIVTIRYAPNGKKLWQQLEKAGYKHASGDDVAVDAEGRIYVTGYGYNFSYWEDNITLSYTPAGKLRWTQIYAGKDYPAQSDYPQAIAVDEASNVFVAAHSWRRASGNDFTTIMYTQGLSADTAALSTSGNGTVNFTLDAGSAHASQPYLLLGSLSGTTPGISLGSFRVPLNPDAYFNYTLTSPNSPPLFQSFGTLDSQGKAKASLKVSPSLIGVLVGKTVHHAFGSVKQSNVDFVSNAVPVKFVR